jgi:hypothetical protein
MAGNKRSPCHRARRRQGALTLESLDRAFRAMAEPLASGRGARPSKKVDAPAGGVDHGAMLGVEQFAAVGHNLIRPDIIRLGRFEVRPRAAIGVQI